MKEVFAEESKDVPVPQETGKFKSESIAELETPFKIMLDEMRPELEAGIYDSLLGDDRGGRIPALVLREYAQNIYKKRKQELSTMFVAGARVAHESDVEEYFRKHKKELGKRTLVVTEYTSTGMGITNLAEALKQNGVSFDVATLYYGYEFDGAGMERERFLKLQKRFQREYGAKIFWGRASGIPKIWSASNRLHGLEKTGDVLSKPMFPGGRPKEIAENITRAREDVHILAGRLIKRYESQRQNY